MQFFFGFRCKLFYKKGKEFTEKGLGMLHLKKVDGGKTQLLVRAETNLGNILLNILVNDQMNIDKRKNNIQFGCIPNPPIPGIMNNKLGKNFVKSLFTKKSLLAKIT